MTETPPVPRKNPYEPAVIVYIIYLAGFVIPFAAVAGLVYAYIERGKSPEVDTHLNFAIRTFWWGLLMIVVGTVLALIIVGFFVLLFWMVWTVMRMITAIQLAQAQQPIRAVEILGMKAV